MNFNEKLRNLRQNRNLSQEALAETVGVSRQAVSKWESGQSFPDMEKLLLLSDLFGITLDALVRDTESKEEQNDAVCENRSCFEFRAFHYEYKSKRALFGIPLVHVNLGRGRIYRAKGILSVGNIAVGIISLGDVSMGLISIGGLALGLVSLGGLAVGLLLALGGGAVGVLALGGVAVGVFAAGGFSLGMFSLGGCAIATHLAAGGYAQGHIAVGDKAFGVRTIFVHGGDPVPREEIRRLLAEEYPHLLKPVVNFIDFILRALG